MGHFYFCGFDQLVLKNISRFQLFNNRIILFWIGSFFCHDYLVSLGIELPVLGVDFLHLIIFEFPGELFGNHFHALVKRIKILVRTSGLNGPVQVVQNRDQP